MPLGQRDHVRNHSTSASRIGCDPQVPRLSTNHQRWVCGAVPAWGRSSDSTLHRKVRWVLPVTVGDRPMQRQVLPGRDRRHLVDRSQTEDPVASLMRMQHGRDRSRHTQVPGSPHL